MNMEEQANNYEDGTKSTTAGIWKCGALTIAAAASLLVAVGFFALRDHETSAAASATVYLSQEDFTRGTVRLTQPRTTYVLTEDIEFEPQPDNDFWPPFALYGQYPPSAYFLGFFAALTVEADDITVDLNGHSLQQSEEFYLLQRFFNVIELNDRVFVSNNGVSSLNYQATDVPVSEFAPAGDIVTPKNVVVRNGRLGRSSHAGIHGNSVEGLLIENVEIFDFEVAGIHCNGCKDVEVTDTVVGPSSRSVPTLATFSNARFLEFYTRTLIPAGFGREPNGQELLSLLRTEHISFADRPNTSFSLEEVFRRLHDAVQLYRADTLGDDIYELFEEPDLDLLEEAKRVFDNPSGLTDGSVQYGIFFNRRGTPETDENFFGAGRETSNIRLNRVTVEGLAAAPFEVASLMTEEGSHMQGPARDLIRIADMTTDDMRTLRASYYKGNFLWDAYFAFWQLSGAFYKSRVFNSECGNFGSNATFPMNLKLYPSNNKPTCAQLGTPVDSKLSGRDVTLLQKRYFGGLQMSQAMYEWATRPNQGLDSLLASPDNADALRSGGRHRLVCNQDTMHHPMHGVVALKLVEAADVIIKDVRVTNLHNRADLSPWVCRHKWQIQPSGEDIMAMSMTVGRNDAATVRGLQLLQCEDVSLKNVDVDTLVSEEGSVIGIDVKGDDNDRTDHDDDLGVSFRDIEVHNLSAPYSVESFVTKGKNEVYIHRRPFS